MKITDVIHSFVTICIMFRTPRKTPRSSRRGARSTPGSGTNRLNGYFRTGNGHVRSLYSSSLSLKHLPDDCMIHANKEGYAGNCDPRQLALLLQTKKKNANHGRWFYTCPNAKGKQCKFFLWKDDAVARETGAVLNNSRSEATDAIGSAATPATASILEHPSPPATGTMGARPVRRRLFVPLAESRGDDTVDELSAVTRTDPSSSRPVKRKRVEFEVKEDYENGSTTDMGEFDSEEERELVRLTDSSQKAGRTRVQGGNFSQGLMTPTSRHSHGVLGSIATPASRRTISSYMGSGGT